VKIRAFALHVDPYVGWLLPSLLTDKENCDEAKYGKWCLADWRLYQFTSSPQDLCQLIKDYVDDKPHDCIHPRFDYWAQPREDFEVIMACVKALEDADFQKHLRRFELSRDFELAVFHVHDETYACNFVLRENRDLSVLTKRP
jgi:hypothetical protein